MTSTDAQELAELRDALNNTRSAVRGIQNQARAVVKLAYDLDERLERYDTRLRQRQAQEAKPHGTTTQRTDHRIPAEHR